MTSDASPVLLSVEGVTKAYPGVIANSDEIGRASCRERV